MLRRYGLIIAYVVLVAGVVTAFWRTDQIRDEVQLEAERRAFVLCETANMNRETITDLFRDALFLSDAVLEDLSQDVQDFQERVRPVREEFISKAEEELAATECPPNPDGVTIPVPGSDLEVDGDGETDPTGEIPEGELGD